MPVLLIHLTHAGPAITVRLTAACAAAPTVNGHQKDLLILRTAMRPIVEMATPAMSASSIHVEETFGEQT